MGPVDQARAIANAASESVVDGQAAYLLVVEMLLVSLLGGDLVVWNGIDTTTGDLMLAGSASDEWRWLLPPLGATLEDNPLALRFLGSPQLVAPTRMSDLVDRTQLRAGRLYAELWKPMGTEYQVGMPTSGAGRGVSRGWAINRARSDFTVDQLDALARLQPALAALEDLVQAAAAPSPASAPAGLSEDQLSRRQTLTARETEVLDLVALGWTARHIAHRLRISPGTVRKHLEHVYAKLGTHDRLTAVLAVTPRRDRVC